MSNDTTTLSELISSISADGKIDAAEVQALNDALYSDGVIDREEAKALVKLNEAIGGNPENDPSFKEFFAGAIADSVLKDETSPGVISEEEAAWISAAFNNDGQIDENEKAALAAIKSGASSYPSSLDALFAQI